MKFLPNILTVLRIILTFVFIGVLSQNDLNAKITAAVIFLIASVSDSLDGYLARKYNVISDFGKLMDPLADKFLILATFFLFMKMGVIAVWMGWIILVREVVITAFRLLAMKHGRILAAERAGKYKTVAQMAAIAVILIYLIINEPAVSASITPGFLVGFSVLIAGLMYIAVFLTLLSGISYLWNNRECVVCLIKP